MQDLLTFFYDLILGVGGSYLGLSFALGIVNLWQKSSPDYAGRATEEATTENAVEETPVPLELPTASAMEMDAIALPELQTQAQQVELELEPVELMEELEGPAPPQQMGI